MYTNPKARRLVLPLYGALLNLVKICLILLIALQCDPSKDEEQSAMDCTMQIDLLYILSAYCYTINYDSHHLLFFRVLFSS